MDTYKDLIGLKGGEIVRKILTKYEVKIVFGYPGGAALPLFDGIYGATEFQFILSHHEQGAGHMAQGYARASHKTGVVLVTSGPGSSNLVTPMLDAMMDGTLMLVLCSQVPTALQGKGAFQEIDILEVSRPCVKWNVLVRDVVDLPGCLEMGFQQAQSGRAGPVLVAI